MSETELTKRQKAVLDFIKSKIKTRGYGPTVREIAAPFRDRQPQWCDVPSTRFGEKGNHCP